MFKVIALVGALAGGAAYGVYSHTDYFGDNCPFGGKKCCQTGATEAASPSCCATPCPACSKGCDECCDVCDLCCGAATSVISATSPEPQAGCPACAGLKVSATRTAKAACCADPCPLCATSCETCCPACPTVCGACCGTSAKAAVAGPAAVVVGITKK
jgi:hypothetical protein